MKTYTNFGNQTASSPELTNAVRQILGKEADAEFVLLVPATPVEDLLDWQEGNDQSIAKRTAQIAKEHLEGVGEKSFALKSAIPRLSKRSKMSYNVTK